MKSAKFLGYDPGGMGKHGVAVAEIAEDGSFLDIKKYPEKSLRVASEVCEWLEENSSDAAALGIDTLLAWSIDGNRACDKKLQAKYKDKKGKVGILQQGSLMGAMTINGVLVARKARGLKIRVFESHPKLLARVIKGIDEESGDLLKVYNKEKRKNPHRADALVAAWCASRWCFGKWDVVNNLYSAVEQKGGLYYPAGEAAYPWPESLD